MCHAFSLIHLLVLIFVIVSIVVVVHVGRKTDERSQKAWNKIKELTKEQEKQ